MKLEYENFSNRHKSFIESLNLKYSFINYFDNEINNPAFSWLFFENNQELIGGHRSIIVDGIVLWRGIFIDSSKKTHLTQINISKAVIEYYRQRGMNYIYTYVDDKTVAKKILLSKLGFEQGSKYMYRFSFSASGLKNALVNHQVASIEKLSSDDILFLSEQSFFYKIEHKSWLKITTKSEISVYIHSYVTNDCLMIDEIISKIEILNINEIMKSILHHYSNDKIKSLSVDIYVDQKRSIIELLMHKPDYLLNNVQIYKLNLI